MQFGRGAVSGPEFAPFSSLLPPAGDGPVHRRLASSSLELLSPSLVLRTGRTGWQCVPLVIFPDNSLSLLLSHSLSCYLTLAPFSCPQGIQAPVLTLSNSARSPPFSPYLLVADASAWGIFMLGVAFRVICGFYLFFLPVRVPSEIRKLPPDPPVRGFPGVWKLPLL